ncbi:hypothetical protein [Nannocystis pusilla]|uniref:hypothetical protein n=1 Tax=Nannocystis pusilla TaxID=889268 RepID=UPI003B7AA3EA
MAEGARLVAEQGAAAGELTGRRGGKLGVGDQRGGEVGGLGCPEGQARHGRVEARAQVVRGAQPFGQPGPAEAARAAQRGDVGEVGDVALPLAQGLGGGRELAGEDVLVAADAVLLERGRLAPGQVVAAHAFEAIDQRLAARDRGRVGGGLQRDLWERGGEAAGMSRGTGSLEPGPQDMSEKTATTATPGRSMGRVTPAR